MLPLKKETSENTGARPVFSRGGLCRIIDFGAEDPQRNESSTVHLATMPEESANDALEPSNSSKAERGAVILRDELLLGTIDWSDKNSRGMGATSTSASGMDITMVRAT